MLLHVVPCDLTNPITKGTKQESNARCVSRFYQRELQLRRWMTTPVMTRQWPLALTMGFSWLGWV